ncbi:MAG: hypothetical protein AVDCRST_MAG49-3352, partial [uncultured Thermomicrobiales bacterium]
GAWRSVRRGRWRMAAFPTRWSGLVRGGLRRMPTRASRHDRAPRRQRRPRHRAQSAAAPRRDQPRIGRRL